MHMWSKGVYIPSTNGDIRIARLHRSSNRGVIESLFPSGGIRFVTDSLINITIRAATAAATPTRLMKKDWGEVPNRGFMSNPLMEQNISRCIARIEHCASISNSASS